MFKVENQRQESLQHLTNMQNSLTKRLPEPCTPETPVPDYEEGESPLAQVRYTDFAAKFGNVISSIKEIDDKYIKASEPDPDYDEEDVPDSNNTNLKSSEDNSSSNEEPIKFRDQPKQTRPSSIEDEDQLIKPRKLANPCLESKARQELHKELLFNYKKGKNVLEKPELDKVLKERKEKQRVQEWDDQKKASSKRTSFELKLEQQAKKVDEDGKLKTISESGGKQDNSELAKVHAKIRHKPVADQLVK